MRWRMDARWVEFECKGHCEDWIGLDWIGWIGDGWEQMIRVHSYPVCPHHTLLNVVMRVLLPNSTFLSFGWIVEFSSAR